MYDKISFQPRYRTKSRFALETQESQWSPSLSSINSFQPIEDDLKSKSIDFGHIFENNDEQEIVTAGPVQVNYLNIFLMLININKN